MFDLFQIAILKMIHVPRLHVACVYHLICTELT